MEEKKQTERKPASSSGTRKTQSGQEKPGSGKRTVRMAETSARRSELTQQIIPFVLYVSALLVLLVLVLPDAGIFVSFLRSFLLGMFSITAYTIPVLLVLLGVFWRSGAGGSRVGWRFWVSAVVAFLLTMFIHIILTDEPDFSITNLYTNGITYSGGGVIGGLLGSLFMLCFGKVISLIILGAVIFVLFLLLFGLTPNAVYHMIKGRAIETRDTHRQRAEERAAAAAEAAAQLPPPSGENGEDAQDKKPRRGSKFDPDVDMSADRKSKPGKETPKRTDEPTDQDEIDARIFDEVQRRTFERYGEQQIRSKDMETAQTDDTKDYAEEAKKKPKKVSLSPVSEKDDDIDLKSIFVDPDSIGLLHPSENTDSGTDDDDPDDALDARKQTISDAGDELDLSGEGGAAAAAEPVPEPEYRFPPLELLAEPKAATAANVDELKENAQRLIDTLRSFNVRTKISNVSHGPTITRYELTPESGTRVRAISNLADDIALSLAAPGVRIEAPIPGKAAVGVEVPNRVRENVYLRGLLENEEFTSSDSRLLTALGSDVAGAPVYCDISKMPHLLVAGATGMGKSVCINSIVVSMLYKARPDEVRLIMIDPKKVEFGVYNGIPHLHVPVINDPKKAAGTLSWAVGEMERRYEMIESVGVRNIQGYNEVTANDPEKPFMPFIVIIIDELADLMMTAPDDVETSICRIAQMGRAAGMHLIIGTQRPSVDVITGLIKANIPSRISCKTSSQVDSRTIIDGAGAEKLLGRGDMLYAPVGVMKPQRVQGAFVSDSEVEKITDFLKGICPSPHYDETAMEGIEEAARQCGNGKKGRASADDAGGDISGAEDPMLRQALELAVDSGKISTSLIQRRLSLGYGRAAKLIDRMEALGYVGAPDGPRPREVLISRQEFQELVLRGTFD